MSLNLSPQEGRSSGLQATEYVATQSGPLGPDACKRSNHRGPGERIFLQGTKCQGTTSVVPNKSDCLKVLQPLRQSRTSRYP